MATTSLEVNLAKQVIYYVRGGTIQRIIDASTGSGAPYYSQGRWARGITPAIHHPGEAPPAVLAKFLVTVPGQPSPGFSAPAQGPCLRRSSMIPRRGGGRGCHRAGDRPGPARLEPGPYRQRVDGR
jgi:hypothetical protein